MSTEVAKCSAFYWAKTAAVSLSGVWAERAVSHLRRFGLPVREIGFTAMLRGEELRFEDDSASLARLALVMVELFAGKVEELMDRSQREGAG